MQKRAARSVTGNYTYESLKIEENVLLYKGLQGAASIPTNDLVPPNRRTRDHHFLAFQTPSAGTRIYKSSFFPQTISDLHSLTDSLISLLSVQKIHLLSLLLLYSVRLGTRPFPSQVLPNDCLWMYHLLAILILIRHSSHI